MTKWIFLFITFLTIASLTDAATTHPVLLFLEKNQFSHSSEFELVFSCDSKGKSCLMISSDEVIRELRGSTASEALELIQTMGMDPDGAYVKCVKSSCRLGNIPDAVI
jgi:hypothetical protein